MTDEEEFSPRSQLKWTREGDAWILLYRRRRMAADGTAASTVHKTMVGQAGQIACKCPICVMSGSATVQRSVFVRTVPQRTQHMLEYLTGLHLVGIG